MTGIVNSTGAKSGIIGTTEAPAVGTGTDGYLFTATGAGIAPAWEVAPAGGLDGVTTAGGNVTITNGNLVMGTSGKGIDFGASSVDGSGVDGEVLTDYEDGDWTPVNSNYSGTFAGYYIKIGKQVTLWGSLPGGFSGSAGGSWTGIPFDAVASPPAKGYGGSASWAKMETSGTTVTPRMGNATSFTFFGSISNSLVEWGDVFITGSSAQMKFMIVYYTA